VPDRWDANLVSGFQPMRGPDPPAIHAHLTTTQQPVDAGPGDAFQLTQQIVIHTLAVQIIGNGLYPHARHGIDAPLKLGSIPHLTGADDCLLWTNCPPVGMMHCVR